MKTILDFLPAMKRVTGNEYAGPCPHCGGKDRFRVWPEHPSGAKGGKFMCRGCAQDGGDGIQFLRDFMSMGFREACEALEVEIPNSRTTGPIARPSWEPKPERQPEQTWKQRAEILIAECAINAQDGPGAEAIARRGIASKTAKRFRIGWNPADRYETPEAWGIEPWFNDKGNPGKVYIPAGIVIPTFRKDGPLTVKVRRRDWNPDDKWPKYHAIRGGGDGCLVIGSAGKPVAIVESELDAILIAQDAGGICSAVALGSASRRPDEKSAGFIREASDALFALDFDEAGKKEWAWWRENFPFCRVWPPVAGKDIGDMVEAGISVNAWLRVALKPKATPNALPEWSEICSKYHKGCFTCEFADLANLTFCTKYSRAGEELR